MQMHFILRCLPCRHGICSAHCAGQLSRGGSCSVVFEYSMIATHLHRERANADLTQAEDSLTIHLSSLQTSRLRTLVTASGVRGPVARFEMDNFGHIMELARSGRQPAIQSLRFNLSGRDWILKVRQKRSNLCTCAKHSLKTCTWP